MSRTLLAIFLLTEGCAPYGGLPKGTLGGRAETFDSASDPGFGMDEDGDTAANDAAEAPSDPAWFAINGQVGIELSTPYSLSLSFEFYPEDVSSGLLEACSMEADALAIDQAIYNEPPIYQRWEIQWENMDRSWDCGDTSRVPLPTEFGLGVFHPELHSRVVNLGLGDPASHLYGWYAKFTNADGVDTLENDTLYVVGYGASQLTLDSIALGDTDAMNMASTEGPLPEGSYGLVGTFLLPIAPDQ